jgi:signal transduction histidine kinase
MTTLLTHCRLFFWVLCLGWGTALATTAPFASWLDTTGTATLATVQQRAIWEPFAGWKGWGYGPEPVWLKVQVPAASRPDAAPNVLIVRPAYLDRVSFYDPAMGTELHSGDFLPPTDDALGSVLFTFEVPALATARDVLVRLQSSSTRVVNLSLMPRPAAQAHARSVEWITGCVLLLSTLFLLWSLVQWLRTRDRIMGVFVVKQLIITLWGFLLLGFARITVGSWFAEGVLSTAGSVMVCGSVAAVFWFFSALLAEYKVRPWMLTALRAAAWGCLCVSLLNFVGHTQESLQIINIVLPVVLLWIPITLLTARPEGVMPPISKAVLLGYACLYAALNAPPPLIHLGLIEASPILFIGNMSVLVIDGLVMLVILHVRQQRFKEQHQAVTTQLMLQQEQARLDQQYLNEHRKLLAMLAHEMKTPLATLRIWMEAGPKGKPVMERAIHNMDRVIERCLHAGQLSDRSLKPRNEWFDAAELTQSVLTASRQPDRVVLHLPAEVCEIYADAQMLSIVFSNVLENAYKYSEQGAPIEVWLQASTEPQDLAGWRWRVENPVNAAGFPVADKVFDKYYRGAYAQRQSGSGLGLFLVKSLLELMHGQVAYTPLPERVRFEVWLPREATGA